MMETVVLAFALYFGPEVGLFGNNCKNVPNDETGGIQGWDQETSTKMRISHMFYKGRTARFSYYTSSLFNYRRHV